MWDVTALKAVALLTVVVAGVALGRSTGTVDKKLAVLAVIVAAILHAAVAIARPYTGIEQRLIGNSAAVLMTLIALLKTCGLWLPAALVPWSSLPRRAWVVAFVIAAAALGEVVFHFPFEVLMFNGVEETPERLGSLSLLVACLLIAAPGFVLGRLTRRRVQPA